MRIDTNFSLGRLTQPSSRIAIMLQRDRKPNTMTSIFMERAGPMITTFNITEAQKNKKRKT